MAEKKVSMTVVRPKWEGAGLHEINADGWSNIFTGLGNPLLDRKMSMTFDASDIVQEPTLTEMYRSEGLATKIVDIKAQDMTRAWVSVDGDTDNQVVKYLDLINARRHVKRAVTWSRLYGGAIIVMGIDDGQTAPPGKTVLELPLREEGIKKLGFLRVYDRWQTSWGPDDIDSDANSENYGKPAIYTISPISESSKFQQFKVHYSRVLRFNGKALPDRAAVLQSGWGDSCLQPVVDRLKGFASSLGASEELIEEFTLGILTINNLQGLIATGKESTITSRLKQIDLAKSIMNTILVDKEEDFRRLTAQVNGIKDILEFLKANIAAVSGYPEVKLFGEQSKGLGSQASGSIRLYYDDAAESQDDEMREPLTRLLGITIKSEDFRQIEKLDKWQLKFNSLWQMSDKEIAEARNLQSQADERYVKCGALTAEEVADSRFGGNSYSFETKLDAKNKGKRALPKKPEGKNGGSTNGVPAGK